MTCSDRSRTHGIRTSALPHFRTSALPHFRTSALPHFRTSALPHFRTSALNYNRLNTLLIRVASFVFAQPSRIVTRIAATGLFALGALAASAMLPVDEARAQTASVMLSSENNGATLRLTYANINIATAAFIQTRLDLPSGTVATKVDPQNVSTANYTLMLSDDEGGDIEGLDNAIVGGNQIFITVGRGGLDGTVGINSDGSGIIDVAIATQDAAPETFEIAHGQTRALDMRNGEISGSKFTAANGSPQEFTVKTSAMPDYTGIMQPALVYTEGTALATSTELPAAVGGTGTVSYGLAPDLPAGLSFTNANPPTISGTPTATLTPATEFTLTATDMSLPTSATDTLTFTITVNAAPPPTFGGQSIAAQRYTLNEDIGTITLPTATGGIGTITYSLMPLTTLTDTRLIWTANPPTISGMPMETLAETEFTLTATDMSTPTRDTATLTFTIIISEVTVEPEEVKAEVETVATLVGAVQTGLTAGLVRSRFSVQPSSGVAGRDTPDANGATGGATTSLTLPDNPRDLADILGGLALEHTADADSGGQYAVWVRGQYTSMDGDPTLNGITVNYDGNSSGLGVGAEKSTGRYVAGVAVNWLTTDLDISSSSDDTTLSKYEESLVMVAPYVSLRRGARTFWFSGGYGIGDADATLEEGEGKASADVEVSFASAGADFVLSERGKNRIIGGLSVLGTRKVVDPLNFAAADVVIPKITLNTFRAQGELTYSRTVQAGEGRVVRPYIGVATLHDAGDRVNDDSHAMDLRGGVDFDGAQFDVSLEASTELLREDHESWSVSGSARYQFDPVGRGASLSLDGVGGDASDIGLEGGYGMMMRQVHRGALLTPFAGIRHGSESGEFSSGMRLAVGDDMDADLRAARAFRNDEDTLKLNFRRTF